MLHNAPLLHLVQRGGHRLLLAAEQRLVIRVEALAGQKLYRNVAGRERSASASRLRAYLSTGLSIFGCLDH